MTMWQVQEAKAKLTQLMKEAKLKPQIISCRGVPDSVVMSIERYHQLTKPKRDIVEFFRESPLMGVDIDLQRDSSRIREVAL